MSLGEGNRPIRRLRLRRASRLASMQQLHPTWPEEDAIQQPYDLASRDDGVAILGDGDATDDRVVAGERGDGLCTSD